MGSVALVIVDDIAKAYDFGPSHPLRPERVLLTYDNIRRLGLVDNRNVTEVSSKPAALDQVLAVHDADFVDAVRGIDEGRIPSEAGVEFGLGTGDNPIFKGMHAASTAVCGASISAAELVGSGQAIHAFNPAGGLHHARRREASGFCIYNDPAVAIARLLEMRPDWRVMYVDVDVHHGDGVQWIFYDDPRVLTMSFHQSGRYLYPGTGFEDEIGGPNALGTSANIPFLPYASGDDYLWALEELAPGLAEAFAPDVVVTQLGADTHWGDPLANLGLTMPAYPPMAEVLHRIAHDYAAGRWVAMGGGGYQAETIVPKVWTIHFARMVGAPESIPNEWLQDRSPDEVSRPSRASIERSVQSVVDACLPRLAALATA